jgi:apolipoprotein N-acyltransferase
MAHKGGLASSAIVREWPWAAAVASGLLLALCYAPWNHRGLVWFALVPLIAAVWFGPARQAARLGWLAGLVFFSATFHWLAALGELYANPLLRGLPLLLGAYLALYPAVWAWLLARLVAPNPEARRFPKTWSNLGAGALAASAWTALEWVRGWLFGGFGWNGLGVALHADLPMIQIADVTGVSGLSWLVAFANVMAVIVVRRIAGELGPGFLRRIRWEFSLSLALVVAVFSYGIRKLMSPPEAGRTISVVAVQPNIPQREKFDPAFEDQVLAQLEQRTLMWSGFAPDLILWPESATPRGLLADQAMFAFVARIASETKTPLLLGTVTHDLETGRTFNSATLVAARDGELTVLGTHHKMHLVPFGEYLPLRPLLEPIAGNLVPGDFDAGGEFTLLGHEQTGRLGALICFEDTVPAAARGFTLRGAEALVNVTNDGWFLRTCAAEQHLANAVFRAVENRRPLIRCANTGVTALVQPSGHIEQWVAPHTAGAALKPVRLAATGLTFYTRHGDWPAWLSCGAVVFGAVRLWRKRAA